MYTQPRQGDIEPWHWPGHFRCIDAFGTSGNGGDVMVAQCEHYTYDAHVIEFMVKCYCYEANHFLKIYSKYWYRYWFYIGISFHSITLDHNGVVCRKLAMRGATAGQTFQAREERSTRRWDIDDFDHEEGCRLRVVGGQGLWGELAGGDTIIGSCVTQLKYQTLNKLSSPIFYCQWVSL